ASADDAGVRPHRHASPLPFLDHFGIRLLDQGSNAGQRLAAPIAQFLDARIDQFRGGFRRGLLARTALGIRHAVFSAVISGVGGGYAAAGAPAFTMPRSRGSVTQTAVPSPSLERSRIVPPCRPASDLAIASPRPEP